MMRRPRRRVAEAQDTASSTAIRLGELIVDLEGRIALLGGRELDLTRTEFDLLAALLTGPGRVWARDALMQSVWGTDWGGDGHLVEVHMGNLRRKLGDDPRVGRYIRTVRGVGYRLGSGVS
jgi:DNA-binding response OmpR family regulator